MASSGDLPPSRSASRAKSIIMMAFFLTMPMSRMMPISAMTERSVRVTMSARMAPTPAEGQRGEDGDGVDVALIQNAEDDVDGDESGESEQRFVGERCFEGGGGALELGVMLGGMLSLALASLTAETASPMDLPGATSKETVTAGNWPWWFMESADCCGSKWVKVESGTWCRWSCGRRWSPATSV